VPFIVRWPGRTPAATVSGQTVCLTDLLATSASILEVKLPDLAGEDSFDLLPALTNPNLKEPVRQTTVLHGGNGVFAFRSGPWKLVEGTGRKPHELYNLSDDLGETKNLAAEKPELVTELAAALAKARSDSRTRP
jgi:arylsulfatase A-like enzyme